MLLVNRALIYGLLFFMLTTAGMTGFAIYRGEVITGLQLQLMQKEVTNIKVTLDVQSDADAIADKVQKKLSTLSTSKEVTIREVEKVVEKPVYRNVCFDDAGLFVLNKAIAESGLASDASEPSTTMHPTAPVK